MIAMKGRALALPIRSAQATAVALPIGPVMLLI
jgi:hypothetical protein